MRGLSRTTVKELRGRAREDELEQFVSAVGPMVLLLKPAQEAITRAALSLQMTAAQGDLNLMDETLVMLRSFHELEVFPIRGDSQVGRTDECQVVLEDLSVSKNHARLMMREGRWRISDEGSKNGTAVNGQSVDHVCELSDGDVVTLGDVTLVFLSAKTLFAQLRTS